MEEPIGMAAVREGDSRRRSGRESAGRNKFYENEPEPVVPVNLTVTEFPVVAPTKAAPPFIVHIYEVAPAIAVIAADEVNKKPGPKPKAKKPFDPTQQSVGV